MSRAEARTKYSLPRSPSGGYGAARGVAAPPAAGDQRERGRAAQQHAVLERERAARLLRGGGSGEQGGGEDGRNAFHARGPSRAIPEREPSPERLRLAPRLGEVVAADLLERDALVEALVLAGSRGSRRGSRRMSSRSSSLWSGWVKMLARFSRMPSRMRAPITSGSMPNSWMPGEPLDRRRVDRLHRALELVGPHVVAGVDVALHQPRMHHRDADAVLVHRVAQRIAEARAPRTWRCCRCPARRRR